MTGSLSREHYSVARLKTEYIDYEALAAQIGWTRSSSEFPTTADGRDETRLDRLGLCQALVVGENGGGGKK